MSSELAGQTARPERGAGAALRRYLARFDEGEVLRWAFRGLLLGTFGVLAMDYYELQGEAAQNVQQVQTPDAIPLLPPLVSPDAPTQSDPRTLFTGDKDMLRQPMRFTLGSGGVLEAIGTIDPGAQERLNAELELRGEYVKVVSLNSPGGSVQDAMAMGRLLRDNKITTQVIDGALCASSCPLMLAGGEKRLVGEKAAVGVHQFYAMTSTSAPQTAGPAEAMSQAQATTARISRYLVDLGIDPALWLHAMDTPPQALYYLSPQEMRTYRLSTGSITAAAT